MKMYCSQIPENSSMSLFTSSGVKAIKLTTTSNLCPFRAVLAWPAELISQMIDRAPYSPGLFLFPRFIRYRSIPFFRASFELAVEIFPVPPINRTFM